MTNILVDVVSWSNEQQNLQNIRKMVFVQEQGVPEHLEWEADDLVATHLLANHAAYGAVGCARLLASGQIGRMAVLAEYRKQGIGSALLKKAIIITKVMKYPDVFLHAQLSAMNFYQRFGFVAEGEEFQEAGIPHIVMRLQNEGISN